MLAESIDQTEDKTTYTFHLRKDVKFHNGKTMTAEDVVASMNRWKEKSSSVQVILSDATFSAADEYTVTLHLKEPSSLALTALAASTQFAAIMPKEIIESADAKGVKEYVGTGPFQLNEWKPDQYIHLTKYADYQSVEMPADGISGKKAALVDDLYFEIVKDASTRIAGVQTGQYDVGLYLPHENYQQLKSRSDLETGTNIAGELNLIFNKKQGVFANVKMRQSVNAALDSEKILLGAFSDKDLSRMNSSYMLPEQVNWYSKAGGEQYNLSDPQKAKQFLQEAGYNGEEITFLATREYPFNYNSSVIVKEQLESIGIKVNLQTYDWATVVSMREDPTKWNLLITGYPIVSTPVENVFLNSRFFSGPVDDKITDLLYAIKTSKSQEDAKKLWDELQAYSWEYLPFVKIGDYTDIWAVTKKVEGYHYFEGPVLWNTRNSQ
ncbi:ABC transporter substrate-binding protein [Brevibacillus sp. B_LB10_24]|uniref:ABC transporter substrate-binding protein n=1 Tax=Brevibacillus sp. B_LB10_24 TaxID=3380645 RepID=UPI0038B840C4